MIRLNLTLCALGLVTSQLTVTPARASDPSIPAPKTFALTDGRWTATRKE